MDDISWEILIDQIHNGDVVPIVGSRLLVDADGKTSLLGKIAGRLLQDYNITLDSPLPDFRELNEAVSIILERNRNVKVQELYYRVRNAILSVVNPGDPQAPSPIPEPIRQLAEVADFKLYVTLTPDDLLAQSLRKRCEVTEIVHSLNGATRSNSLGEEPDLPRDWNTRSATTYLLYLFGKSAQVPTFAIHDEDVLEYAHNVISRRKGVPKRFLDELPQRNLLFVGCNFPDWLTRFFLRATNDNRLSEKNRHAWLIEPRPEEPLTCFLRSYSKETEVLSQDLPVEFVAELWRRWTGKYGGSTRRVEFTGEAAPHDAMFFISYSRQGDITKAESLYQALRNQGVDKNQVWIDRKEGAIEPGQDYERKILDGIRSCRYFLPVVSQDADDRSQTAGGYVFKEWDRATSLIAQKPPGFLLPVIVDSEYHPSHYKCQSVWEWCERKIDFGHAPGGVPDDRLNARLKSLVREARRSE